MFLQGLVEVEILIPGGIWGVERKKISRLAIAHHDPPCNSPLIFTLIIIIIIIIIIVDVTRQRKTACGRMVPPLLQSSDIS